MASSSSHEAICITGLGMVTPLGHDVVTSCAAARTGISRAGELKVLGYSFGEEEELDDKPVTIGNTVMHLGMGFSGAGKVIALGAPALLDLLARRPLDERDLRRTSMILNLSDCGVIRAHVSRLADAEASPADPFARWRELTADVPARIASACGISLPPARLAVHHGGSAGLAQTVERAIQSLRSGAVDRCLVGAIESRVEPSFLVASDALGMLRTRARPAGMIPGEAAAFLLLERSRDALDAGITPLARIAYSGQAKDPTNHFDGAPANGEGLSRAIRAALADPRAAGCFPTFTIGDLNGTERRAREWGLTLAALQPEAALAGLPLWIPAVSFGDTGAAAGAVAACMAVRAFERSYAPGESALLWLSSETGACAALGVVAPHA